MLKEITVLDEVKSPAFVNHALSSGKSGSGKTTQKEFELENYYLFGNRKCIDFDISGRFENCTYSIPEDDPSLLKNYRNHPNLKEYKLEPMGFKDEVILICGRGLLYNKTFPKNFKIMSFREEDLSWEYLNILLGGTESSIATLNSLQMVYGTSLTLKDIWDILVRKQFRGEKTYFKIKTETRAMIINRIRSWMQSGMFSDKVEKIDFEKIINDRERITCISTYLLEQEQEEEIAIGIWLDKIIKLNKQRKVNYRVVVFLREVMDYMNKPLCKKAILHIIRKGRILGKYGIDFLADTQRAVDIKPMIRRQFGYYNQLKSDFEDAKRTLEIQYIPPEYLQKISRFNSGDNLIVTGVRWDIPVQNPTARHKHVSPQYNTLNLLIKKYGRKTFRDELVGIKEEFEEMPEEKPEPKKIVKRGHVIHTWRARATTNDFICQVCGATKDKEGTIRDREGDIIQPIVE